MAYEQVRDVLEHAAGYHRCAADNYRALAVRDPRERLRMLLRYLARHETELADIVGRYRREAPKRVLDTWVTIPEGVAELAHPAPEGGEAPVRWEVDDLINAASERDELMVRTFESLVDWSAPGSVAESFEYLRDLERLHQQRMVRQTARLNEL